MRNLGLTMKALAVLSVLSTTAVALAEGRDPDRGGYSQVSAADRAAFAGILKALEGNKTLARHEKAISSTGYSDTWLLLFGAIVLLVAAALVFLFARRADQTGNTRLRWTVGAKLIGGFSILAVALTGMAIYSLSAMGRIGEQIDTLAEEIIPLTNAVAEIEAHQLQQTIALERAFRFGAEEGAHAAEKFEESVERFRKYAQQVDKELADAAKFLEEVPAHTEEEAKAIVHAMDTLARIDAEHHEFEAMAEKAIELIHEGKRGQARLLEEYVEKRVDEFAHELEAFLASLEKRTEEAAHKAETDEHRAATMMMGVAFASVLMAFVIAVLFTRQFTRKIGKIASAANDAASGDFSGRLSFSSQDELGELAQTVNQMMTNLRGVVEQADTVAKGDYSAEIRPLSDKDALGMALFEMTRTLRDVVTVCEAVAIGDYSTEVTVKGDRDLLGRALNEMITNLGDVVEQINSAGSQMVSASREQAEGAKMQSVATAEMTSTVTELRASATEMTVTGASVAEQSQLAAEECAAGTVSVESAVQGIKGIHERVEKIAAHMLELGSKSQQISGVLDIITELSEQTNLLSLNASIEAAGAGEAGKRFAVVASEIRKLADRATDSTGEIRSLIDSVQETVNATIMATEEGTKAVQEGVLLTAEVDESFERIAKQVASTTQSAKAIEMGSRQQATAIEQMEGAVKSLDTAAQQTAETARQLDTNAQALLETARKLQGSEQELQAV